MKPMTPETVDKLQNAAICLVLGAAIPLAIGFGAGFWVTKSTAEQMINQALLTAKEKICVAQFTHAPNYQEKLKELKALEYSAKDAYFEKGGWAKMPGEEKASSAVKEACTRDLEALLQK